MSFPRALSAKLAQRFSQPGHVPPQTQLRAIADLRAELSRARGKVAELENQLADRNARLSALPATYGFADLQSFIHAVVFSVERERLLALGSFEPPRGLAAAHERTDDKPADGSFSTDAFATASADGGEPAGNGKAEAEPPLPTGTSLEDPTNFGQLPDNALVDTATPDEDRLRTALAFARRVLHTSRVPARVWRAWRDFERKAAALLRSTTPGVVGS